MDLMVLDMRVQECRVHLPLLSQQIYSICTSGSCMSPDVAAVVAAPCRAVSSADKPDNAPSRHVRSGDRRNHTAR